MTSRLLAQACACAAAADVRLDFDFYPRCVANNEQLPGFDDDGEYSERAFEAWLGS